MQQLALFGMVTRLTSKKPHPIWTTPGSNQYEITKAVPQAHFLSGPYRTESLARQLNANLEGFRIVGDCDKTEETIEHILIFVWLMAPCIFQCHRSRSQGSGRRQGAPDSRWQGP